MSVKTGLSQPQPSAPPLPCPLPASWPSSTLLHARFLDSSVSHPARTILVTASHAKKKKNTAAAKTLNDGDGALQLTNRQWDRQANRRSDSGTGSSRTAAQHTLGQLHTNTHTDRHRHTPAGGKQSQLGGCTRCTRLGTPAWGHHQHQHTNTTTVARIGGLVLMAAPEPTAVFLLTALQTSVWRRKLKQAAIFVWVVKHRHRLKWNENHHHHHHL